MLVFLNMVPDELFAQPGRLPFRQDRVLCIAVMTDGEAITTLAAFHNIQDHVLGRRGSSVLAQSFSYSTHSGLLTYHRGSRGWRA